MPIPSKRVKRIKKKADNAFSALTGIEVTKLTGPGAKGCWICPQQKWQGILVKKVSAAAHDPDFLNGYIERGNRFLNLLSFKGTCGVDQCVNPEHIELIKKEYQPWA